MSKFKLVFKDNYFKQGDTLLSQSNIELRVLNAPSRKWYKLVLQFLTFGLYRAPWYYTVKPIIKT